MIKEQVPLKDFCTLGIGGPARYFISVSTIQQMEEAFSFIREKKLPFYILGKGSNLFFADKGFGGIVVHNKIEGYEFKDLQLIVKSGTLLPLVSRESAKRSLSGLEFGSGIPASVGGALFMNAGANKKEISSCLDKVEFLMLSGEKRVIDRKELVFGYRSSSFQKMNGVILEATFVLHPCEDAEKIRQELLQERKRKQPQGVKSAGCMFRNPKEGPAGLFIEEAGLKGFRVGGAEVSTVHANFLINRDNATAEDMQELIAHVQKTVFEKKAVELHPEVCFVPYRDEFHAV